MSQKNSLFTKVSQRIARKKSTVLLRADFADLGGYDRVGKAIRQQVAEGTLIKIGYGLYAKAKISPISGKPIPLQPLPTLAKIALKRLGIKISASRQETEYNKGRSKQVPTGRVIAVSRRVSRKIGYGGINVSYERTR